MVASAAALALSFTLFFSFKPASAEEADGLRSLEQIFLARDLTILADVKHGVPERIAFFSSAALFESMRLSGVRHVAIEMPRVLGRQAMGIDTDADVESFAQDVIRSGRWRFTDPDNPLEQSAAAQRRVATALGRQVLHSKRLGLNVIFYDFNNPLGEFRTHNDPVYRCLAAVGGVTWIRYGLEGKIAKADRDAAIMRERFSHDDELAAYIEENVKVNGGGKLVVIPGYAHAAVPGGLAERLEHRLKTQAAIVATFKDKGEGRTFHAFLWEQSRLLSIDLSRPPHYYYTIDSGELRMDDAPGRYVQLDGWRDRNIPSICFQTASKG